MWGQLFSSFGSSLASQAIEQGKNFSWKSSLMGVSKDMIGSFGSMLPTLFSSPARDVPNIPRYGNTRLGNEAMKLSRQRSRLALSIKQSEELKKARQQISTQQALFAGRGFGKGGSTSTILQNESLENLRNRLSQEQISANIRILEADIAQIQGNYSALNNLEAINLDYESPFKRTMRKSFLEPMQNESIKNSVHSITSSIGSLFSNTTQ